MIRTTIEQAMDAAVRHHQAGRLHEAESIYRQVLGYQADHPNALHLLGVLTHQRGQSDAGIELIRRAIAIKPDVASYHFNLGNIYRDRSQQDDALAEWREACRLDPRFTAAQRTLGAALMGRGAVGEAIAAFTKLAELEPNSADAHNDLAVALVAAGEIERSTLEFEAAIRLYPGYAEAHNGLAGNLLLEGRFGRGWLEYEWRWRGKGATSAPPNFPQSQWRGQSLEGKTILLYAAQGFGDSIQFVRFDSIPAAVPYLTATARTDLEPGFKVGIAWSGRPTHPNDANRSTPIGLFEPISKIDGVALHSLQKESPPGENSFQLIDHSMELTDFAQTANLIAAMDLVISVDTAVTHLAGAIGKDVWLLVPYAPDWRWMLGREDSPWYPTMRIFRQGSPGDWEGVIQRVADELAKRVRP